MADMGIRSFVGGQDWKIPAGRMVWTLSEVYREDVLQGDDLGNLFQAMLPGMMGTDIGSPCFGPLLVFP